MKDNRSTYFIPLIVWAGIIVVLPFILLIGVSLYKTNFLSWTFVGMKNYISAFERGYAKSILNSILYLVCIPIPGTFISFFIALAMSNLLKRTQSTLRALYYIPLFSAGIIASLFWRWLFSKSDILMGYGAIPAISLVILTTTIGPQILIFSMAIMSIDPQITEAGKIDGASAFMIKMKLIMPQLWKLFSVLILFAMVGALQIWETIYMLAPFEHTSSMMFRVFQDGFMFGKYGLASAECIIMVVIILLISLGKQRVEKNK